LTRRVGVPGQRGPKYSTGLAREMKIRPVSAAVLVKNAKRAKKWYHDKLGLSVIEDGEHWITVGDAKTGMQLHLCEMTGRGGKPKLEPGNTGILLMTDGDIEKTYAALKKKGVTFPHPPERTDWGGWFCMFADPDGNEFWLNPEE
jgi:predicted enzyme related to lactoylglutathione lyase